MNMIQQEFSFSKNALNVGAVIGLILSVIQLIAYTLNLGESQIFQWIIYIIMIAGISWAVRKYRDVTGGYITYGQSLGFGMLLTLGTSLIFAFTNYLYIKFLNPDFIQYILEQLEITLYESGTPDDQVEMFMNLYNQFLGPGTYAFGLMFNFVIIGLIASLIISIFVKNPKPMFEE